jgi:cytochrome c biogenesis protein CcdA
MTSISPCPLATNITAIAFISKEIKTPRQTLLSGCYYALGRGISYTLLALIMYLGLASFQVARIFQGWGDKVLGPILIIIGLVMLDVIKLNLGTTNQSLNKLKIWLASRGYLGALLLGMLFALAFCPYSGVLFFGVLTPLILNSQEGLLLAPLFALGTALPVITFSFIIAFSVQKMGQAFTLVAKIEKISRYLVSFTFIVVGLYYTPYLIKFLFQGGI